MFNGVRCNVTVTNHSAQIANVVGDASSLKCNVKLDKLKFESVLVINGEVTNDFTIKDRIIDVTVPFADANVQ